MTDQKLIQALRCCAEGECKGCAVYADKQSCQENILAQAADRLEGLIKAYGEGRIVVPVVHGRWIYKHRHRGGVNIYEGVDSTGEKHRISVDERYEIDDPYCSECGKLNESVWLSYCPNCGAKMDGGSDHE